MIYRLRLSEIAIKETLIKSVAAENKLYIYMNRFKIQFESFSGFHVVSYLWTAI